MVLRFTVPGPVDTVYAFLADMDKFVSVHPAITQMFPIGTNTYQVHETLMIGPLPYIFSYPAEITGDPVTQTIRIHATVRRFTHILLEFSLTPTDAGTLVQEALSFRSPFPVKPLLRSTFKKQHAILFKNIASAIAHDSQAAVVR